MWIEKKGKRSFHSHKYYIKENNKLFETLGETFHTLEAKKPFVSLAFFCYFKHLHFYM